MVYCSPGNSDELPPPNPEWNSETIESHKAKRQRFSGFVEGCRAGKARQCFYAGVNLFNSALAYTENASVPSYSPDASKAATYYRMAAEYHTIGCNLTGTSSRNESCKMVDTALRIASQLNAPIELPAVNPSWSSKDIEYHTQQRERFKTMVENCNKGVALECYYAGNNLSTAARGYSGKGTVRTYEADKTKELEYYKLALEFHIRACELSDNKTNNASCTDRETLKWRIASIEDPVGQQQRDIDAEKEKTLARERRNRVTNAIRQYINRDCSRLRLLAKSDGRNAVALTSLTNSMSVENGYCVASNGITKHTIGVSSVYSLKCDSETATTRRCNFGYNIRCQISSQFGKRSDNERISDWICKTAFGGKYSGSGVFITEDGGKTLKSVSLKL